jgi:hypothetical protein
MADEEPSSSSAAASRSTNLIIELNDNDVLLGRGRGIVKFVGNQRFRRLVEERKEEYSSFGSHKDDRKARIARELFDRIHERGGRFLKPVEDKTWYEVEESVALEKCMQALRQKEKQHARAFK